MSKHTPTPWANCERAIFRVIDSRGLTIATVASDSDLRDQWEANAVFIVKAVNSHDALVFALTELYQSFEFCVGKNTPVAVEARHVLDLVGSPTGVRT